LRKIHICEIALPIFWEIFGKNEKLVSRNPISLSDTVFALRGPPEYPRTPRAQKLSSVCSGE